MALGENAESEEVSSLRDDLAANLKAIEERESATEPQDEEPKPSEAETDAQAADPEADRGDGRDAHGRFVSSKPKEESPVAEAQLHEQQKTSETGQTESAPTPERGQTTEDSPPKSWRADEAKAWANVPPEARAAILRREAETARLAGANDGERMFGREFAEIVRPHMDVINSFGVSPQFAVKALLENDRLLRSGTPEQKLGKARQLLSDYGIDLTQLADPNAPNDPHVLQLQREVEQLRSRLTMPQQQQFAPLPPTPDEVNVQSEIEEFRADPAHPHFDAVMPTMGRLLETGAAPDLESAYQAAVAMDPALRSTATIQVQPQRTQEEKTAAAKRASVSVTSSPGPTGSTRPLTLRDELAEGLRSAGFSV